MLHRFAFAEGRRHLCQPLPREQGVPRRRSTGKITYAEFATDPCRTLFGRVAAIFDPKLTDNCCVNVMDYARRDRRLHRDDDADALSTDHARDARRVRLSPGAAGPGLHRAPALRREARLPLQLHRRFRSEQRVSAVPDRRRRQATGRRRASRRASSLYAQLRHDARITSCSPSSPWWSARSSSNSPASPSSRTIAGSRSAA